MNPLNVDDFIELHMRLGLALWHCQACEDTLVHFITLVLKLPPSRAEAEAAEIMENLRDRKTLGGLIAELRKANSTDSVSEFEQRVNRFLSERNWLVHKSWREHHTDLFTPEKLPQLYKRLQALADEANALQGFFGQLVTAWTLQQGATMEDLNAKTREILRKRGVIQ